MKARPILFSGPMIRALLDGSKTQTRRAIKYKNGENYWSPPDCCPYGKNGDLLWVREAIAYQWPESCDNGLVYPQNEGNAVAEHGRPVRRDECDIIYRATDTDVEWMGDDGEPCAPKWTPSIHMPRRCSRLTLDLTGVRVERLQDIRHDDAIAEGVIGGKGPGYDFACHAFMGLWQSINGKGSWDANPWVWVLEFRTLRQNVDAFLKARAA